MGVRATRIILSAGGPTTYYVSAAGNDANDGRSLASPKRTIAGVNGLSLKAGDTVAFRGGDTFNDAVLAPKQGAAYTSYGTGKATLSPSGGSARIVDGLNVSDLVFSNLTLGGTTTGYGIFLQYTAGVNGDLRFSGIDTAGVAGRHLFVDVTSAAVSLGDIVIENSVFFDASGDNVVIAVDTATIASVTIENCISSDAEWQGMYVGGWPSPGKVGTMNVSDCTFSGNGYTGLNGYGLGGGLWERCVSLENGAEHGGGVGIFAWLSNNVTIRHCESFGNTSPDADGDGFDLEGCTDCVIEYCYSHDNKGAGFFMYDYSGSPGNLRNTFRYNISENDGSNTAYGGITLWAANGVTIQDARIYNNTVYSDIPGGSCLLLTNGPGLTGFIANNIFRASGTANQKGGSGGGSMTVDKNVWYGGVGSGYGTNKITTDPLLVDPGAGEDWGYLLQPGSPAAAAGVNIATTYSVSIGTTDYFGTPLGAPPLNLGCYGGITVTDLGIPASIYHTGTEYYPRNPWYIKAWEDGRLYLAKIGRAHV